MTSPIAGAVIVLGCCAAAFVGTLGLAFLPRRYLRWIHDTGRDVAEAMKEMDRE